ncbi:MAG TPA: pitrilysin family protein [Pirellulaceae bacterium]|nr:pitrilysin family protein [Pirellulaceae bacterium]HMO90920.1 pitrilysin family protein [Pirellulaceae bacterium]HMP68604.1 pitrilysin family protein [Pirellulaceae bacterium]
MIAQQPKFVTEIEGIKEYRLDNGVQVLLFPDESKPQITVNMTVLVGSRHEGYGETGMAHLLEHMLFKGTPTHHDIPKLLKDRGVLNMNGTTWYDRTNYYSTLPANDDNLEFLIHMEADRLVNSTIKREDLMSEMTVVRNEFEIGENSPMRILMQRINAVAFEWHNYGKSTIGNRSDIERVPIENLHAFYRKFYQPDNIMVVVAGQFENDKALELVDKYFGSIPAPERELQKTYTEEPAQDGERSVVLRRVGDVALVAACYHIPPASHDDFAAVQVLGDILGTEPGGRLYKNIVETKKAASVFSLGFGTHDPGTLLAGVQLDANSSMEDVEKLLLETIESIGDQGVSETEVNRAVQARLKSRENLFADSSRLAVELSEWRAYGDWRLFFLHRDRLEKVTPEQVQAVAKKYLIPSNRTLGKFIPTTSPLRVTVPHVQNPSEYVADYQGRKSIAAGEKFEPTPENIELRTVRGTLDSGFKYAFLPKKTRGERVFLSATFRYGDAHSLLPLETEAKLLPSLMRRGTTSLDFEKLDEKLNEIRTTLSLSGDAGNLSVEMSTRREFLHEAMAVLADVLRSPALDNNEFEVIRNQTITEFESQLSEPQSRAFITIQQKLAPYAADDIRYVPTLEESIERYRNASIEKIQRLYNEFLNGKYGEVAIVGDFEAEEVLPKLTGMLDNWESKHAYKRIERPFINRSSGEEVVIQTPDKKNAMYIAGLSLPLRDDDPNFIPATIGNYILGGGPLSSRLADRVRKQEGLSYAVGSMLMADANDRRGAVIMFAMSKPDVSSKVDTTIKEELQKLLDDGVLADELESAKSSFLEQRKGQRANDEGLVRSLRSQLFNGRDMNFDAAQDSIIADLTKEHVDSVLREILQVSKLVIVRAGDFEASDDSENE